MQGSVSRLRVAISVGIAYFLQNTGYIFGVASAYCKLCQLSVEGYRLKTDIHVIYEIITTRIIFWLEVIVDLSHYK